MQQHGTLATDGAIVVDLHCVMEDLMMPPSSTAHEVGTVLQYPLHADDVDSRGESRARCDTLPPELHLAMELSRSHAKHSGEALPGRGPGERDVLQLYLGGVERTVVQREANLLDANEAPKYPREGHQGMLESLQLCLSLGAFERVPSQDASNLIHARWVLRWKNDDDKYVIQARLVVRGLKDLQASQLHTFLGATSR